MTERGDILVAEALRAAGIPAPWAYGRADEVRFHELDALGHVNNVTYLAWFETIRARWLSDCGLRSFPAGEIGFVVMRTTCDYRAPMFLGDRYIVTLRCAAIRRSGLRTDYAVWRDGTLTAEGEAIGLIMDPAGTRKIPIPEAARTRIIAQDAPAIEG